MTSVLRVRNPRTNRDKFYEESTNKLIAYFEEPDLYGDQHLTITEYGAEKDYCSYNNVLINLSNPNKIIFKGVKQ